jgi:hypothetical protein
MLPNIRTGPVLKPGWENNLPTDELPEINYFKVKNWVYSGIFRGLDACQYFFYIRCIFSKINQEAKNCYL